MFILTVNYFSPWDKSADIEREISCQKAVSGNNFAQGNQDFNFSIGNPMAARQELLSSNCVSPSPRPIGPAQPKVQDQLAFADDAISCLYNVYFRAGGQDVSSIVNYVAQAHALKMRVMKSGAWL